MTEHKHEGNLAPCGAAGQGMRVSLPICERQRVYVKDGLRPVAVTVTHSQNTLK